MSEMEEGAAPSIAGAGLGVVTAALARANVSLAPGAMYAEPTVAAALVRAAPEAVPAITDVEAALASIDQGGHRLGDLLSS